MLTSREKYFQMKPILLALGFFLVLVGKVNASESLLCARIIKEKLIRNVDISCPKNDVCFGGWVQWELQVDRVLEGDELSGRITTAAIQTSQYIPKARAQFRVFKVRRIEDSEESKLLGADFILVTWAKDNQHQSCRSTSALENAQ